MPRKPRKRPRSSKIGLPDSDQWTSCSLAGRTTTSEKGKRADRWKPRVLRSSIDVRAVIDRQKVGELAAEQRLRLALEIVGELLARHRTRCRSESVSQNQPRPLFSNSSTKLQRLLRLPFEPQAACGRAIKVFWVARTL